MVLIYQIFLTYTLRKSTPLQLVVQRTKLSIYKLFLCFHIPTTPLFFNIMF